MSELTPELMALEATLRDLLPSEGGLDRERVLFEAGRASARPGWGWPVATLLASATAVALGLVLLVRPPRVEVVERPVPVEVPVLVPAPPPSFPPPAEDEAPAPRLPSSPYHRLHEHLLRWGLDGIGDAPSVPVRPVTIESLLAN